MYKFILTQDVPLIRSVLCHQEIYSKLHDDFAPPPEEWYPEFHPCLGYLAVEDDLGAFYGIAILMRHSPIQYQVHNALLPHLGWKTRLAIGKQFIDWLFASGVRNLIGKVDATNKYTLKFNECLGMKKIGVNRKSIMRDHCLHDEVWFEACADEWLTCSEVT